MPVFDFSGASDKKTGVQSECTYTTFQSNEKETSPEKPIMVLDNSSRQWKHHSSLSIKLSSNIPVIRCAA